MSRMIWRYFNMKTLSEHPSRLVFWGRVVKALRFIIPALVLLQLPVLLLLGKQAGFVQIVGDIVGFFTITWIRMSLTLLGLVILALAGDILIHRGRRRDASRYLQ